ncbi:nucleoside diphosphate-linked moiety X motif 8 isoform X2 [Rana temporaria]|uniref:nucleoside diphosphate-linked moiety X motif 8 isoform X2 n=1 Tax=Rana temporaria TaxID=8407 RepID=UPI001AAC7E24|nr:nucleoside diphosphate-linked moiety X motif 8 isoform X2 [Rana temporaria]
MSLHLSVVRRGLCTKVLPNVPAESLSYETEQRCREVLSRTTLPVKASAGVLVTLCTFRGAPSFLYTLRSPKLKGRHKGDISFPGGKCDASDKDIIDTALREAREELGVSVAQSTVWGAMKPITDWVESLLTLPLSLACTSSSQGYTCFRQRGRYAYTLPVFRLPGHKVWGLTAMMTDSALSLLFPGSYRSILSGSRSR